MFCLPKLVLSCSEKGGYQYSENSKSPAGQLFICVCVCVYKTIISLCVFVSFPACLDSTPLMDGVFRCEKVNRSPTGVSLSSLSLQIAVSACPCVCVCAPVCACVYECTVGVHVGMCAQHSTALCGLTHTAVLLHLHLRIIFYFGFSASMLKKTEQPA